MNNKEFEFFYFLLDKDYDISTVAFKKYIRKVQIDAGKYDDSSCDYKDNIGEHITDIEHYGTTAGLYWVWKNCSKEYIGFSLGSVCPKIWDENIDDFLKSGKNILAVKEKKLGYSLRENYKTLYYDYDLMLCMDVLKMLYPTMYEYALNNVILSDEFILPTVIMRKDIYRKFAMWLFSILEKCKEHCGDKRSKFFNMYLEHLSYYLLNIYIKYNAKDKRVYWVEESFDPPNLKTKKDDSIRLASIRNQIEKLYSEGELEKAEKLLVDNEKDESLQDIRKAFADYKRQRRHYKSTIFDNDRPLSEILQNYSKENIKKATKKKPTVFIFRWNSFTDEDTVKAFEELGFECDYIITDDIRHTRDKDITDIVNTFLDKKSFDLAFSINYFEAVSEACYVHGIPYIAWAYDSPTDLGDRSFLNYDTSNVFLFDTSEVYANKVIDGFNRVKYMPLAADTARYDSMECTKEEYEKYKASISFVGQMYENKLAKYMQYLSDYDKAYLNGIIDCALGRYNSDIAGGIINSSFAEWFPSKQFLNAIEKGEIEDNKKRSNIQLVGNLHLLMNQMITNKERIILSSMLSKHWDFRLYSDCSHETITDAIEMGRIDYKTVMPKVFKASKINLNITLRAIKTGIPQRCIDVLGCRAFLLSNYQEDFDEYFTDGVNVALFNSLEEAYDKCDYYLSHEQERLTVTNNGYELVKKCFSYKEQIRKMLKEAELLHLIE